MTHQITRTKLGRATVMLLLVILVLWLGKGVAEHFQEAPARDKYQAVFLTNGTVYIGKLSGLGGDFLTLKDVYIFQTESGNTGGSSPAPKSALSLARLDENKLIRPEQEMTISKTSLLFWENMQDDADVVKKIKARK